MRRDAGRYQFLRSRCQMLGGPRARSHSQARIGDPNTATNARPVISGQSTYTAADFASEGIDRSWFARGSGRLQYGGRDSQAQANHRRRRVGGTVGRTHMKTNGPQHKQSQPDRGSDADRRPCQPR
jgi:hypothetical protein